MKTSKKVLLGISIGLLVTFALYVLISFIVNKDGTMYWINQVIDWLNKPLPIIGVTTLALLIFVWKVVVATNYGKAKLLTYDKKVKELENAKEEFELAANEKIKELEQDNDKLRAQLIHVCELSTNKKIKDFGKELEEYGEETTNC